MRFFKTSEPYNIGALFVNRFLIRLNFILLGVVVVCGLAVITSQHKARHLFIELQKQQNLEKKLNTEWGQLQLEQSTWAMHSRVEHISATYLKMHVPDSNQVQVVTIKR